MPNFTKRPVQIEARHYTGANGVDLAAWIGVGHVILGADGLLYIDTLEGTMSAEVGDWIVRGIEGEFYPVKPSIFERTYREVEAEA
jgi:hypothetical protein